MRYPFWAHRWLPRQCALDRVDVVHSPFHFGLPWSSPCPRVLTLHDAIDHVYYASRTPWRARWAPRLLVVRLDAWAARVRAERIITVSQHARDDLTTHLGVPLAKIAVIPEAADPRFHTPISIEDRTRARRTHGLDRPYVFYVGGWEERKNLPFLVRAFADARLEGVDLVLAGGRETQRGPLIDLARALGAADRLRLLGWVEEADLPALYAESLAFVNPSEYEGFGLQLCEAMAAGCPTLAARATALPEVLGAGGETFSLDAPDELINLLRRIAREPDYRDDLASRALARSADFSWSRTAEETLMVYHSIVNSVAISSH